MAQSSQSSREEALKILGRVPLIDGHNDWAFFIRGYYDNQLDEKFDEEKTLAGHVDIPRLLAGRSGGVFWSAYIACPEPDNDFSDAVFLNTIRDTMQQIDTIHRLIDRYSSRLELVEKADDIERIFKAGKIASMLGVEGLHQIGNSPAVLRNYYRLGVRYITLTHNSHNLYADCAMKPPIHGGLSQEGRRMVLEMNRVGLIVDLAHVSEGVMLDALEVSKAPVAFTHSNCSALVPHFRNVSDQVIRKLKDNGGIMMIAFVAGFANSDPKSATMEDVVDHIMHVAGLIGFEHIGLGSDFDGTLVVARGLEDVSKYPDLVESLLKRGISPADVENILGWNLIRVFKQVERVSKQLKDTPAMEDRVARLWNDEERKVRRDM